MTKGFGLYPVNKGNPGRFSNVRIKWRNRIMKINLSALNRKKWNTVILKCFSHYIVIQVWEAWTRMVGLRQETTKRQIRCNRWIRGRTGKKEAPKEESKIVRVEISWSWQLCFDLVINYRTNWVSLVAQMVNNLPTRWETCVPSQGWEDPLQKGMATNSSILAWRILWTEDPDGLQSIESQRFGHDWVANTFSFWHWWV